MRPPGIEDLQPGRPAIAESPSPALAVLVEHELGFAMLEERGEAEVTEIDYWVAYWKAKIELYRLRFEVEKWSDEVHRMLSEFAMNCNLASCDI